VEFGPISMPRLEPTTRSRHTRAHQCAAGETDFLLRRCTFSTKNASRHTALTVMSIKLPLPLSVVGFQEPAVQSPTAYKIIRSFVYLSAIGRIS